MCGLVRGAVRGGDGVPETLRRPRYRTGADAAAAGALGPPPTPLQTDVIDEGLEDDDHDDRRRAADARKPHQHGAVEAV
jgi:hypothetical protein